MKQQHGDILSQTGGVIVQQVNAQGVMGSGIAFAVKNRYPDAFTDYKKLCVMSTGATAVGKTVFTPHDSGPTIANCITQLQFGREGKKYVSYKAIQECFETVAEYASRKAEHVHYPLIGAGLGGGDWAIISEIIDAVFAKPIYVHINRTLWIYE